MSDYKQPDFYRFNSDSIELIKFIKNEVNEMHSLLDLGAGCGVIGIELARFYMPQYVSFVELQADFKQYLLSNIAAFLPPAISYDSHFESFSNWFPEKRFDVIVCNPPYYLTGHGQPSSDIRRGMCRSFIQDNWTELLQSIERSLETNGKAFLVVKNEKVILKEVESKTLNTKLEMNFLNQGAICFLTFRLNKNRNHCLF